jgi:hypothetical protein
MDKRNMSKTPKSLAEFLYQSKDGFILCYAFNGIHNTMDYFRGYCNKNKIGYSIQGYDELLVGVLVLSWWQRILSYFFKRLRNPVTNKIKILPNNNNKSKWCGYKPCDYILSCAGNREEYINISDKVEIMRRNFGRNFWIIGQYDDLNMRKDRRIVSTE